MSGVYDLFELVGRVRRVGGDVVGVDAQTLEGDGTDLVRVPADGFVNVLSVSVDGASMQSPADYDSSADEIRFTSPVLEGAEVEVRYQSAAYDDNNVLLFLEDAASEVAGDLSADHWRVQTGQLLHGEPVFGPELVRLIALRGAVNLRTDISNTGADDAIMVQDGDTRIDLSAGARSGARVLERLDREYDAALRRVQQHRFCRRRGGSK